VSSTATTKEVSVGPTTPSKAWSDKDCLAVALWAEEHCSDHHVSPAEQEVEVVPEAQEVVVDLHRRVVPQPQQPQLRRIDPVEATKVSYMQTAPQHLCCGALI
jgi:hypothetical protein